MELFGKTAILLIPLLLVAGITACELDGNKDAPDVSGIEVTYKWNRFDQDLFQLDTTAAFPEQLAGLEAEYDEFADLYFNQIMFSKDPELTPQGHEAFTRGLITYPAMRELYDTTQIVFGDMRAIREEFDQAFRYLQYYFPEREVPSVTTFLSEFTIQAFIYGDDDLAVGLDYFLGRTYPYLKLDPVNPYFSNYLTRTYTPEHLATKTLTPLVQEIVGPATGRRMLDEMIREGKTLYILDHFFPGKPDSVIMEVSGPQWEWLVENEQQVWAYFLTQEAGSSEAPNLLYSTDWATYRKFVEYSPNSPGMPEEAPGRTASYLGWKIIEAWMERSGDPYDLGRLVLQNDAQRILEESKYKPAR